jgi:hypothetical protein
MGPERLYTLEILSRYLHVLAKDFTRLFVIDRK